MADEISIGRRPPSEPAPWAEVAAHPGDDVVVDLGEWAARLLEEARSDARGRASAAVLKGPVQRALLVALTAGSGLGEHSSPPAASLHVLSGRFRLFVPTGDDDVEPQWFCGPGQLVPIPPDRHAVDCLEDGVFLLTVTLPGS